MSALDWEQIGGEDPIACGQCGSRTAFEEISETRQQHYCERCDLVWVVEFEESDENEMTERPCANCDDCALTLSSRDWCDACETEEI